jgi:hypothetical protein
MEPSQLQGREVCEACEVSPQERGVEHTSAPRKRGVGTLASPQGCGGAECPHYVFIVTSYGCNSTPSDLWVPHSKIFTKYDEAYAYFLKESPPLDDEDNRAEQVIHNTCEDDMTRDYVVIEHRVELAGYHCGDGHYAKRPRGAVIARSIVQ